MKTLIGLLSVLTLCSCMSMRQPDEVQRAALVNPPPKAQAFVGKFLPRALDWYDQAEADVIAHGRPLTDDELQMAKQVGVSQPQKIRILVTKHFPDPKDQEFRNAFDDSLPPSFLRGGLTTGYGILLKPHVEKNRRILAHEMVHVTQIERMGREAFLKSMMYELVIVGYLRAPLELEAYEKTKVF